MLKKISALLLSLLIFPLLALAQTEASSVSGEKPTIQGRTGVQILVTGTGEIRFVTSADTTAKGFYIDSSTGNLTAVGGAGLTSGALTLSDSITFTATDKGLLASGTDKRILLYGGGTVTNTHASLALNGSAYSGAAGNIDLVSGAVTGSKVTIAGANATSVINFAVGAYATTRWQIDATGQLVSDATNGNGIVLSKTGVNVTPIYNGLTTQDADLSALTSTHPGLVINQNRTISDSLVLVANAADTLAGIVSFAKTRATAPATNANTIVVSGDEIGGMRFLAADGASFRNAAQILVKVDGTPGASDMPGRIEFYTTNDGSASATLKWTMSNTGTLIGAGTADIGWTRVNAANVACNTTCVTPCVFGWDTAAPGVLLACTDATADSCLCAGAS